MSPDLILKILIPLFAFGIGASIGSFLNVVIYRVPNGLSVNEPKRSFCPDCGVQIPMALNIPLVSWLMLRGKCKWCDSKIAFRYFLVELITGIVFFAIWRKVVPDDTTLMANLGLLGVVFSLWVLASLLISATFIDFDHFIIPDSITIGGTVVGVVASIAIPALHHQEIWWQGGLQSLIGAAVGFVLIWMVVLMGKLAFGRIKHEFDEPANFEISQPGGDDSPIVIKLGEHTYEWGDVFYRKWDRLELEVEELFLDDVQQEVDESFCVTGEGFETEGEKIDLESVKRVTGKITSAVVPREAMGFGDVKFVAMIGAFLGWQSTLFVLFAASVIGAVVGLFQKFVIREEWSRPLPFGPYLALAAFVWIFTGPALVFWYLGPFRRGIGLD
ncbi:MAG: prepilin peptidase [Verrucomicrobiota bacterium]